MTKVLLAGWILFISISLQAEGISSDNKGNNKAIKITPSEVFTEALRLDSELETMKNHFGVDTLQKETYLKMKKVNGSFKPKHVWQLAYMLNVKINMFRVKHNLPRIAEVGIEPVLNVNPNMPYGMLRRQITEIQIIKKFFHIDEKVKSVKKVHGKTPTDVFNKLLHISKELDKLNKQDIDPSRVFSQVMRLYQDVTLILKVLNIKDDTLPSKKNKNSKPKDAFKQAIKLIKQIQRVQRTADIQRTDFSGLHKKDIVPEDVFIIIGMANAEIQTLKAYLGLKQEVAPLAKFYSNKTPSDVEQLIGWVTKRIELIKDLEGR